MTKNSARTDIEQHEEENDRQDGKAPVNQGGNPSPTGQDEPRNEDIAKQTI